MTTPATASNVPSLNGDAAVEAQITPAANHPRCESGTDERKAKGARTLKQRALHGSAWTLGSYALGQVLRLGTNLVLTRLLFPEAFGIMALVMTILGGLQTFLVCEGRT